MKKIRLSTAQTVVIGFLTIILIGAVILSLPISSSEGKWTGFTDSLFMSVTSVCVTGLTTLTPGVDFSLFGQLIMLILIQLGGLGVVCCGIGCMMLLKRKISIKERKLIQTSYNLTTMDGMVRFVKRIIKDTFIIEGIGLVLYAIRFMPEYGPVKGLWFSLFHAVSAFCNAGIDLLGSNSLMEYQRDVWVNLTTIFLIIAGGIGFPVIWDVHEKYLQAKERGRYRGQIFQRLTLHSKLAITTTLLLLIGGTVLIFAFEYNNPNTLENMSFGEKWMASLFESVTTRTAGFFTIPQENFRDSSYMIQLILMFIGGCPLGTAGGIKTTTIAMLVLSVRSEVRGEKNVEVYDRRIENQNIRTGLAIVLFALTITVFAIICLTITEQIPLKDLIFECVSAIGTVGLGRGAGIIFSNVGKILICLLMFAGRIGGVTLAVAFASRKDAKSQKIEKAAAKIMLG